MSDFLARIKPKRSTVTGETPNAAELHVAEIALNTADGKIFTKHTDGTIKEISGSGGGGGSTASIEDVGNVERRLTVRNGIYNWDTEGDATVPGGWEWDSANLKLKLNKLNTAGDDIRVEVVALPTTGILYFAADNVVGGYVEETFLTRTIDGDVISIELTEFPHEGAGTVYVTFSDPYLGTESADGDFLVYDETNSVWKVRQALVSDLGNVTPDDDKKSGSTIVYDQSSDTYQEKRLDLFSLSDVGSISYVRGIEFLNYGGNGGQEVGNFHIPNGDNYFSYSIQGNEVLEAAMDLLEIGDPLVFSFSDGTTKQVVVSQAEALNSGTYNYFIRVSDVWTIDDYNKAQLGSVGLSSSKFGGDLELDNQDATPDKAVLQWNEAQQAWMPKPITKLLSIDDLSDTQVPAQNGFVYTSYEGTWPLMQPGQWGGTTLQEIYISETDSLGQFFDYLANPGNDLWMKFEKDGVVYDWALYDFASGPSFNSSGSARMVHYYQLDTTNTPFPIDPREADLLYVSFTQPAPEEVTEGMTLVWDSIREKWISSNTRITDSLDFALKDGIPLIDGDVLKWSELEQKWMPGVGGGGGGGAGGSLRDLDDVETLNLSAPGFETGFEVGDSLPEEPEGTFSQSVADSGQRSYIAAPAGQSYGTGAHVKGVFAGLDGPRYDVVRMKVRSTEEFTTDNRLSLGGTKASIAAGGGWTVYTRDTGFSLYLNGQYTEVGTKPPMLADTWYEIVYVLDWGNGRGNAPTAFSLWVDGAICVDSFATGNAWIAPTAPDDTRFYFASSTGTSGGDRFVDKLQVRATEVIDWSMSDATIDTDSFFSSAVEPTRQGQVLRYSAGDLEWRPQDLKLGNIDDAGFNLFDTDDDPTKPYATFKPRSLGSINYTAHTTKAEERWAIYANETYGMTIGKYHLDLDDGGTIADERERDNEARRTYYGDKGIMHNLGDKPLWLNGALGEWTDNTPELRWTSGNPLDSSAGNNGNYVGLKLPAGLAEDMTYTLPAAKPIGQQYLSSYGDGTTQWVDPVVLNNTNPFSVTASVLLDFEEDPLNPDQPAGLIDTSNMTTTYPAVGGKFGNGAEFVRASADYIDVNTSTKIGIKLFTFEFWYKSSDADYASGSFRRIFAPITALNSATGFQVVKRTTTAGKEGFICLDPDGSTECGTLGQTIDDDLWHHIVFQHLGGGVYTTYLDGVEVNRTTRDSPVDFDAFGGFRVGGRNDLDADAFFEGSLDGIALYLNTNKYLTNFDVPTAPPELELIVAGGVTLTTINELADVDTETTPPLNGQALIWNEADQTWQPGSGAGGVGAIYSRDLADVRPDQPAFGDVLVYTAAESSGVEEGSIIALKLDGDASNYNPDAVFQSKPISTSVTYSADVPTGATGSSAFFGNGRRLEAPDDPVFNLGGDDFTLMCWFKGEYAGDVNTNDSVLIVGKRTSSANNNSLFFQIHERTMRFQFGTGTGNNNTILATPTLQEIQNDTWHHAAVIRQGSVFKFYLDGVLVHSEVNAQPIYDSTAPMMIGTVNVPAYAGANEFYLKDVLLTKSVLYTEDFTPPLTLGVVTKSEGYAPTQIGPKRRTETATVTGAEDNTDYDTEIDGLGNAGTFLKVSTSHAAWVRFYSDPDSRTADASRGQTESPARGSGVLLELITTGSEVYKITPAVSYINLTDDLDGKLYVRVTNLSGATEDLTIDVTALVIEA